LGYKPQDFINRPVSNLGQILTPNSLAQAVFDTGLVLKGKIIPATIYEFIAKNGTMKIGEVSGSPVIRDGKVVGIVAVARDITERKRLEEALRYSEARFDSIITTSQEWVWEIDSAGRHTFSNPAIENILGYHPDEIVGHSLRRLIHEEDIPMIRDTLARSVEQKVGWPSLVLRWKHRDGSYRYLESNAVPILDSAGIVKGFQGSDRDITDRKQLEEEREKLISELQRALSKIKTLSGLLPICSSCKKIRDDKGYWTQIESYITNHSEAEFSHGICPDCFKKLYSEFLEEK
jgi:PAS domain S-box-containing protein